jgi:hypothetical protein
MLEFSPALVFTAERCQQRRLRIPSAGIWLSASRFPVPLQRHDVRRAKPATSTNPSHFRMPAPAVLLRQNQRPQESFVVVVVVSRFGQHRYHVFRFRLSILIQEQEARKQESKERKRKSKSR